MRKRVLIGLLAIGACGETATTPTGPVQRSSAVADSVHIAPVTSVVTSLTSTFTAYRFPLPATYPEMLEGGRLAVGDSITALDADGRRVLNPVLTVQVSAGWSVSGDTIIAPATPSNGTVTVSADGARLSFPVFSVPDMRKTAYSASWSCSFPVDEGPRYNLYVVDTMTSSMTVDSVRYRSDLGVWSHTFRYILYASGTTTYSVRVLGRVTFPETKQIGIVDQWADSLSVAVVPAMTYDGVYGHTLMASGISSFVGTYAAGVLCPAYGIGINVSITPQ